MHANFLTALKLTFILPINSCWVELHAAEEDVVDRRMTKRRAV